MKKWQWVAPLALIAAVLFAGSFLFPATYQVCAPNDFTHAKECASHHLAPFLLLGLISVVDLHNGIVIAIATAVLSLSTVALWASTRDAATAARKAAEALPILERAYVFVHVVDTNFQQFTDDGMGGNKTGEELSLRFTLRNHGRTPAIIKSVRASLNPSRSTDDIFDSAIKADVRKIDGSNMVIEAGKELAKPIAVTSSVNSWYAYFSGRRMRLFGVVTYEDVFRNKWKTEFSLRFEGTSGGIFELWPEECNRRT